MSSRGLCSKRGRHLSLQSDQPQHQQNGAREREREASSGSSEPDAIERAPSKLVITGVYGRVAVKYGDRAERYVHLKAGHAAQNVLLVCVLGLGAVPIGPFDDNCS